MSLTTLLVDLARRYPTIPNDALVDIVGCVRHELGFNENVQCQNSRTNNYIPTSAIIEKFGRSRLGATNSLLSYLTKISPHHSRKECPDTYKWLWLDTPELWEDAERWKMNRGKFYFF